MTTIKLAPIAVPQDAAAPDASDFRAMVDIRNRVDAVVFGENSTPVTPAQMLPAWRNQVDKHLHGFLVQDGDEVVGRAVLDVPMEDGSVVAMPRIELLPEHWGRGIGRFVLPRLEELALELGRTTLHVISRHVPVDGPRLTAATGIGSIPRDHIARFLGEAGFGLAQVHRTSALDLTAAAPALEQLRAQARTASPGYRYVSWTVPTPAERIDDYAYLKSRMSTDAPSGDLEIDEENWDAARIARLDEQRLAQGLFVLVGAAEHITSGRLVAYTELAIIGSRDQVTWQEDTLVQSDHRGHRLGALVKCETLARWRELVPESPSITTNNAEENRHMLAVNEAMGFRPIAYSGLWEKHLHRGSAASTEMAKHDTA